MRGPRAAVLLLIWLLAACAPFNRPVTPSTRLYLLERAVGGQELKLPRHPGCRLLLVEGLRAAPGYRSSRMVYRREAHRLDFFAYHRWADTPAEMLHPLLLGAIETSGLCAGVTGPTTPVAADHRLEVELLVLQQEIADAGGRVSLEVRMRLYGRGCLLGTGRFREEERAAADPGSGAEAANRAAGRMVAASLRWIGETMGAECPALSTSGRGSSPPP